MGLLGLRGLSDMKTCQKEPKIWITGKRYMFDTDTLIFKVLIFNTCTDLNV